MEFAVLGPLRMRTDDRDVTPPGRLQRTLLGMLLLHAGRPVPAEVLAEALWGRSFDERSTSKLHLHVHRLRRLLGDADRLTHGPLGYRLTVLPGELDAERFEGLITEAVDGGARDQQRCATLIREALGAWRGTPFDGLDAPELADEARRLVERRLVAIEELYTVELARGRHTAVAAELPELVREHPLRERLHGLLMVALYQGGQQAKALGVYRAARAILVEELGQEPGPELRRIEQLILAGEPVELGAAAPGPSAPAQLPHDVHGFTGREPELSALDDLLRTDGPVLISAVAGSGGVGKTALAVRWAHRVRDRFPDGQLYADLRGYGPESPLAPEDALGAFLRELGVDGPAIPGDLDERAARFRSLVAGRRIVIVLDNARSADQVRPLLPGGSSCAVVVTSRDSLAGLVARDGARRIVLDRLSDADARRLLRELAGGDRVDTEPDAVDVLIERCARLPLALRIATELINSRPHLGIGELVEELADERDALDVLDAGGDPDTAVRRVFSWSYRGLPPDAARLFRLLGAYPGRDVDSWALAALSGHRPNSARRSIGVLLRAHLIDKTAPGRYEAHDLLRAYAAELAGGPDHSAERDAALGRYFDYLLHTASVAADAFGRFELVPLPPRPTTDAAVPAFADEGEAARWLHAERANLVDAVKRAVRFGRPDAAIQLSSTIYRYLQTGGYHDEALAVHHVALTAARAQNDLLEEGNASRYIGSVHYRLGHRELAWEYMSRSYECYQRAGDPQFIRMQLMNLGVVRTWLGHHYADALRYLSEALRRYREAGPDGRWGCLLALVNLSRLHICLGDPDTALRRLLDALDIAAALGPSERMLDLQINLGVVYGQLGRDDQAVEFLERAWALARETHHRVAEVEVFPLGHVYWRLGRRTDAFACVEHCLSVARSAGDSIREPTVLNALGTLQFLEGAHTEALEHHRAALGLAREAGQRHDEADAHAGIGDAGEALGDLPATREHRQQALRIYRALGTREADAVQRKLDAAADVVMKEP